LTVEYKKLYAVIIKQIDAVIIPSHGNTTGTYQVFSGESVSWGCEHASNAVASHGYSLPLFLFFCKKISHSTKLIGMCCLYPPSELKAFPVAPPGDPVAPRQAEGFLEIALPSHLGIVLIFLSMEYRILGS
jgi:hypothetical protein